MPTFLAEAVSLLVLLISNHHPRNVKWEVYKMCLATEWKLLERKSKLIHIGSAYERMSSIMRKSKCKTLDWLRWYTFAPFYPHPDTPLPMYRAQLEQPRHPNWPIFTSSTGGWCDLSSIFRSHNKNKWMQMSNGATMKGMRKSLVFPSFNIFRVDGKRAFIQHHHPFLQHHAI